MPTLRTTAGQLMINESLPEDLRDWQRVLDKKGVASLLSEVAQRYPERYREVVKTLSDVGRRSAFESGSNSFGLRHMRTSPLARQRRAEMQQEIDAIDDNDQLSDDARTAKVHAIVGKYSSTLPKEILDEATKENNPLAAQINSGARGNELNLSSLRSSDLLYVDSDDKPLPVPIMRSYSEGLSPVEYWAGSYGARKGVLDAKFATADAGWLSKKWNQSAHRLLVTADDDDDGDSQRGMPSTTDDNDNAGALLASAAGGYPRNTLITPKILSDLRRKSINRILVRSPIVGGARDGGLLARDVGVREFGHLPYPGTLVGLNAAQSMTEKLSQGKLSSKHSGGVAGAQKTIGGFDLIAQLTDIPKTFRGGAAHSRKDGVVNFVAEAPAGGQYVTIDGEQHYVPAGANLKVGRGDRVEAGDILSSGIPNPAEIVRHKGIGEGRRYFAHQLRDAFRDAGIRADRRNAELMARGLIDHVRIHEERGDWIPGDVVSYQSLERAWEPRDGHTKVEPRHAVGKYLERPAMHYTIGTKVQPSMLKDFDDFGVKELTVHDDPAPFEPEMIRGADNLHHDPDWITKMYGSGLKGNLLKDVHRGATSSEVGTSFVPGLAKGLDFGLTGKITPPKPPKEQKALELPKMAAESLYENDPYRTWQDQMLADAADSAALPGFLSRPAPVTQGNWAQRWLNPHAFSLGAEEQNGSNQLINEIATNAPLAGFGTAKQLAVTGVQMANDIRKQMAYDRNNADYYNSALPEVSLPARTPEQSPEQYQQAVADTLNQTREQFKHRQILGNQLVQKVLQNDGGRGTLQGDDLRRQYIAVNNWARGKTDKQQFAEELRGLHRNLPVDQLVETDWQALDQPWKPKPTPQNAQAAPAPTPPLASTDLTPAPWTQNTFDSGLAPQPNNWAQAAKPQPTQQAGGGLLKSWLGGLGGKPSMPAMPAKPPTMPTVAAPKMPEPPKANLQSAALSPPGGMKPLKPVPGSV